MSVDVQVSDQPRVGGRSRKLRTPDTALGAMYCERQDLAADVVRGLLSNRLAGAQL